MYPTIFEILSDLCKYKINPNRFDKLWKKHRWELGKHVSFFDGVEIPPKNRRRCNCAYDFADMHTIPECQDFLTPQSGNASLSVMSMLDSQQQNIKFSDQSSEPVIDVGSVVDKTRTFQDSDDASLEHFFSRPIKILDTNWTTTTTMYERFEPWALYFENKRVANRISNFNLLRCKLRLKFVINGNSFLYGRAMASYQPYSAADSLTNRSSLESANLTSLSQMPKVLLNPTQSTGGELILPFFWHKNYMNIPTSEWDEMGSIIMKPINQLKHANGATDQATISVFAWCEDVQLSVLTSLDTDVLVPQAGEVDEANQKGMVSGPATKVANVANMLSSVPFIAPYAAATSKVASMTASMAKVLGYSRPPCTVDPAPYRPTLTSSLALTTVPDGATKLTVDDKQELSIDPTISGMNASDPLDITSIAQRESFLTKFTWDVGRNPEQLLWNARVSPVTWADATLDAGYYLPACAFAALPFKYWTGSMNFRFQVVSSGFHRGRLKIVYDPNYIASNEYNTNYVEIVDIAEKSDFTITIGNGQNQTFLEHLRPGVNSSSEMYSTVAYTTKEPGNGVIAVYVVNELTIPNDVPNNDIEINVFVSMGDDFEVAVPIDDFQQYVLRPQSGELESGELDSDMNKTDEPYQTESSTLGPTKDPLSDINSVYFGEAIKSFRPLLKRYALHECIGLEQSGTRILSGTRCFAPYLRGNVFGAVHTANSGTTPAPYNYVNTLLVHWINAAHCGFRGGMRYKIIPRGDRGEAYPSVIEVERVDFNDTQEMYNTTNLAQDFYTSVSDSARAAVRGNKLIAPYTRQSLIGANGMHRISSDINPVVEFEAPFYSNSRFIPGKLQDLTGQQYNSEWNFPGWGYRIFHNGSTTTLFEIHHAVAEDYSPYFFTGLPPIYYEAVPPPL